MYKSYGHKNNTKPTTNLSTIKGTFANLMETQHEVIDAICLSDKPITEVRSELIEFIKNNSRVTNKISEIIYNINQMTNKVNILTYLYNSAFSGSDLGVIKCG